MKIWIDAQLSPALAIWIRAQLGVEAIAVRDLGLREASDEDIFEAARKECATVMTKDSDFVQILERQGSPPKIIWITCGNTSNANLKRILGATLRAALELLSNGDDLVEISEE